MTIGKKPQLLSGCWLEASVSSYVGFHWAAHKTYTQRFFPLPVILKAADALEKSCENLTGSELEKGYLPVYPRTYTYKHKHICMFFSVWVVVVV